MINQFANLRFNILDINTNARPDLFLNKNCLTITKKVLEEMGYPPYVQYCIAPDAKVFAIKVCGKHDEKAVEFSKPKEIQQNKVMSTTNKNLRDILTSMIGNYNNYAKYTITGQYDNESRIMYFDMTKATSSMLRRGTLSEL